MNNFSSWFRGIKSRLLFAACLPVVGFAIVFFVTHNGIDKMAKLIDSAHSDIIPNSFALAEMRQSRNKFGFEAWNALNASSKEDKEKFRKNANDALAEFEAGYKIYTDLPFMPEEEKLFNEIKPAITEIIRLMHKSTDLIDAELPEKDALAKEVLLKELQPVGKKIGSFNRAVVLMYKERAKKEGLESQETKAFVFNMLLIITGLASILVFGFLTWVAAKISNSISKIGNSLMASSSQVTTSVEQLNEAGNSLSQSSTEAAASLEETVAALEELTSMVQMNSDNAKQAAGLSTTSRDSAEHGESEIKRLIQSMTGISKSSKKIEEIISVIDDIAFQTNLLALNAAVEAARAGDQGKGFAVVAEAVRSLAQRSASSAKDISVLIKDSVSQIEQGSKIADQSGTVLANIVTSIKKVSDLNNEIAAASSEQTTGIQQISKAMNQLDQSSQSNAASAEEIAATSGEISNLAQGTHELTVALNNLVLGNKMSADDAPVIGVSPINIKRKFQPSPSSATVHTLRPKAKGNLSDTSSEMIPFDEDGGSSRKVGNTNGF